jgi:GT2 family glycosyltransferase
MKHKTAVLVPIFNGLAYTKECLKTLESQINDPQLKHEYVVVVTDDGSTDGSGEYISEHFPEVELLKGDGNLWWSGGINVGARHAIEQLGCDYVLLWNNDVLSGDDYFIELDKIVEAEKPGSVIGSKVYYTDRPERVQAYGGYFSPVTGVKYSYGYDKEDTEEYHQVKHVDWLPGMGTLVHVDVVTRLDYWDAEHFPQYHGDTDFTFKAKKAGFEVKVLPQLKLWNNTENTGINYPDSYRLMFKAFSSIRSDYHLGKDILFYRRHATSPFSIYGFGVKYFWLFYGTTKRGIKRVFGRNNA